MIRPISITLCCGACAILLGCQAGGNNLLYASKHSLGVNIDSGKGGKQTASVGFNSDVVGQMPINPVTKEAPPMLSTVAFDSGGLTTGGLTTSYFESVVITGHAALEPRAQDTMKAMADKVR